jgi:hypothetical protein
MFVSNIIHIMYEIIILYGLKQKSIQSITRKKRINFEKKPKYDEWMIFGLNEITKTAKWFPNSHPLNLL